MQNNTLIKENIQKLVLHHRKTIINEVVKSGVLREGFEKNKLPKDLTEEQLLYLISECLSEDGNFIIQNYKLLTHPNPTPEMLDESKFDFLVPIFKAIPGLIDDAITVVKGAGKWAWEKVGDTWKWIWKGEGKPNVPKPEAPPPTPNRPRGVDRHGRPVPDGRPRTPNDNPYDPAQWDIDPDGPYGPDGPGGFPGDFGSGPHESVSNFNHNMKQLMESNRQIDPNFLHTMLKQVNESKYLLELAIQRNQVNRIIDRI
jgi:hypothetical protein